MFETRVPDMYQKASAVVFKLLKRSIAGDDVGSHVTTFLSAAVSPSAGAREQGSEARLVVLNLTTQPDRAIPVI